MFDFLFIVINTTILLHIFYKFRSIVKIGVVPKKVCKGTMNNYLFKIDIYISTSL